MAYIGRRCQEVQLIKAVFATLFSTAAVAAGHVAGQPTALCAIVLCWLCTCWDGGPVALDPVALVD